MKLEKKISSIICFMNIITGRKLIAIMVLSSMIITISCRKFIAVEVPETNITEDNVFNDDNTASAAILGIYTQLSLGNDYSILNLPRVTAMSLYPGLSSDELTLYVGETSIPIRSYYQNSIKADVAGPDFWKAFYPIIMLTNSAINGLTQSTNVSPILKQQLLGEAYFIRSFCYFYLVNLYGDVPLILGTDYLTNAGSLRTPKDKVYEQIIEDLTAARNLVSINYVDANGLSQTTERVRPNRYAVSTLLARVFLYKGDYINAEIEATKVIDNKSVYDTVSLANVFLKNSKETIWAIQPVLGTTKQNTAEGRIFILPTSGPAASTYPVYLSTLLMNSFELGDMRKSNWTKSVAISPTNVYNYAYKYKIGLVNQLTSEYVMVLRLGELYLIRAEARANIGTNLNGAASDLNVIRKRAGLSNTSAVSASDLLTAISHERQVELFTEWGHRWLDLKRTGKVDVIMSNITPSKGGVWDSRMALYPIPGTELSRAPQLIQNPGYER